MKYTHTESAILDYLATAAEKNTLPITANDASVEWLYTNRHGRTYGIKNEHAQAIAIISEHIGEQNAGGVLVYVRGRCFANCHEVIV